VLDPEQANSLFRILESCCGCNVQEHLLTPPHFTSQAPIVDPPLRATELPRPPQNAVDPHLQSLQRSCIITPIKTQERVVEFSNGHPRFCTSTQSRGKERTLAQDGIAIHKCENIIEDSEQA